MNLPLTIGVALGVVSAMVFLWKNAWPAFYATVGALYLYTASFQHLGILGNRTPIWQPLLCAALVFGLGLIERLPHRRLQRLGLTIVGAVAIGIAIGTYWLDGSLRAGGLFALVLVLVNGQLIRLRREPTVRTPRVSSMPADARG